MVKGCIFCKIVEGKEKAWKVYEDDACIAFLDAFPVTEGHALIITKHHITDVFDLEEKEFMHLFEVARKLALKMKVKFGAEFANIITAPGVIKHAFIHVVPRYDYDLMGPVPDMENKRKIDNDEMGALVKKLGDV
ncbi:MAG: HIT family protein [Candidatus Altiarchaeota archaeon]|nr:HIT family protein [Candidatus Altiarchaeota archaeon]